MTDSTHGDIGYFPHGAVRNRSKRFLGSAPAHRSIRCGVALRRLLPVLPPVLDVLLGRCGSGVTRVGQCLRFVDQAKRPIEQLRRFLATRSNGHRHKQRGPTGRSPTSAGTSLVRASALNSRIQVFDQSASGNVTKTRSPSGGRLISISPVESTTVIRRLLPSFSARSNASIKHTRRLTAKVAPANSGRLTYCRSGRGAVRPGVL